MIACNTVIVSKLKLLSVIIYNVSHNLIVSNTVL